MQELRKVQDLYNKLCFILTTQQKRYAILVMVMACVAALLELLGVSIVVPIMEMLLNYESIASKWYIAPFVDVFHLYTSTAVVWFVCLAAIAVFLVKNLYFILYNWVSLKFSFKVQRELSKRVLSSYMKQGYLFFVNNNSSRLLQGVGADVAAVYEMLNSIFSMVTKVLTIIGIGVFIIIQSKDMALLLITLSVICLGIIQLIFRKSMRENGIKRRNLAQKCTKISIEAIQGNKEILVMNKEQYFVDSFADMQGKVNAVSVIVNMGARSPSYIIEMICITGLFFAVAIQMGMNSNSYELISTLSTIAIAAFRILPALGTVSSNINSITMSTSQLQAAYETLQQVKEAEKKEKEKEKVVRKNRNAQFTDKLQIEKLTFSYPGTEEKVIDNMDLTIRKGESVAFIGSSGAGKTTLSDIILGLLKPTEGQVCMDGIDIEDLGLNWNRIIGYVPQMVNIVDDTIRHNIAFGEDLDKVDDRLVWESLRMAQLEDFVKSLPDGLETMVGEHGIRFSGGQRQRLAIARALYRNPDILVLDEATAALDNETESAVMESIESLQGYKTLIIVAHRLTTVKDCDAIYEIRDGKAILRSKEEIFGESEKS